MDIQIHCLCQEYAYTPISVVLTTMGLTGLVSVENIEYLMLNSLFQPQPTLQIESDYRQITFLTGCFMS